MRVALIGRTEILSRTAELIKEKGHVIVLIITAKEAPEYRVTSDEFKVLSNKLNVPFMHTSNIVKAIDFIKNCGQIDIGISLNYSGIIPESVTSLFSLGILNAHGGDLPRYRGNACQAWAIINGEKQIGLCIHRMIGGELDSGDIIARDYLPIDLNTKISSVYQWLEERIPHLFLDALAILEHNPKYVLEKQSKDPKDTLRCYPRNPDDGRIDWSKSAIEILRLVNASGRPYQGAYCYLNNDKLIIWDAELAPNENYLAIPGQVTLISENYVEIATGDGKLRLLEIQVDHEVLKPSELVSSIRKRLK